MRDSTELAALQGQLSSHKSVTDTLRAQTHEFANQLHTISGLVQLGEYDSVRDLVGTLTRRRAEISDAVTQRISDPAVAALLIAKTSLAAESGVSLELATRVTPRGARPGAGDRRDHVAGQPHRQRGRRFGGLATRRRCTVTIERPRRPDDLGRRLRTRCARTSSRGDLRPRRHLEARRARRPGHRPGAGAAGHRAARRDGGRVSDGPVAAGRGFQVRLPRFRWRGLRMRDVLVVDDDFMVAEIHRRFVEQVDGFRAVGRRAHRRRGAVGGPRTAARS